MNFGWRFHAGDLADGASPHLDDATWRTWTCPTTSRSSSRGWHPAPTSAPIPATPGANVKSRLSPRGFKEMGIGWYRKTFTPRRSWQGRRVLLDFEGILYVGDAYLNGQFIGKTDYGYLGFEADMTKLLRWGEDNVLAVRADTRGVTNSRWYTGGGLYRDVHVVVTDPEVFFTRHPLRITTNGPTASVLAGRTDCLAREGIEDRTLRMRILDREGAVVAEQRPSSVSAATRRHASMICLPSYCPVPIVGTSTTPISTPPRSACCAQTAAWPTVSARASAYASWSSRPSSV